ncbi:S1C family serine protease [Catellatospora bangladeshensis]|uniref:Trypsin-like serine protease n=1 Tax=Catellatospora bangladeshensis TaxID=310355 RepID=A0A8J3NFT3_9ACTN|nr:trypsin-like peptidase domain-containing protein [Catellatospora bangladeshensis]GIF79662.1 hypothetical protein Cba03nite_10110 [Catellatospora bangladeshensis]
MTTGPEPAMPAAGPAVPAAVPAVPQAPPAAAVIPQQAVPGPFPPAPGPMAGPFPPAAPQPWPHPQAVPPHAVPPHPQAAPAHPQALPPHLAAHAAPPYPVPPHAMLPAGHLPPGQPPAARPGLLRRLVRPGALIAALLAVLVGLVAWQTVRIEQLGGALERADDRLSRLQQEDKGRLDAAESRLGELEKEVGGAFNVEKVAAAVLPSVFRVEAGRSIGTAFAVGPQAADGGTNLFTNYHVVEEVWKKGGRTAEITRAGQRFNVKIVRVDKVRDVAHLHTTAKFKGLTVAAVAAKPGQQVIAVGAPLGLTDTVTSGVISAIRETGYEEGPMVQFDAAINPGNSGGPVINGQQEVVGIAVAGYLEAEGLGLAIPIADACKSIDIC